MDDLITASDVEGLVERETNMVCDVCGFRWDGRWSQPDRFSPPEALIDYCPRCEGEVNEE